MQEPQEMSVTELRSQSTVLDYMLRETSDPQSPDVAAGSIDSVMAKRKEILGQMEPTITDGNLAIMFNELGVIPPGKPREDQLKLISSLVTVGYELNDYKATGLAAWVLAPKLREQQVFNSPVENQDDNLPKLIRGALNVGVRYRGILDKQGGPGIMEGNVSPGKGPTPPALNPSK